MSTAAVNHTHQDFEIDDLLALFPRIDTPSMANDRAAESGEAAVSAEVSRFSDLSDDAASLKRMRVETVEILSHIAQKSLTEPLLNSLRLWSTTTHPYAVAQQWEHALDTLAIRSGSVKDDHATLSRAKDAVTDWYHRMKFDFSGRKSSTSTKAGDLERHTKQPSRTSTASLDGDAAAAAAEGDAAATAGSNPSRALSSETEGVQDRMQSLSRELLRASGAASPLSSDSASDSIADLHALDSVVRTTQWARVDRRLAGKDKGVPLSDKPDIRPDVYVLLMRPHSVGFVSTSSPAVASESKGSEGTGIAAGTGVGGGGKPPSMAHADSAPAPHTAAGEGHDGLHKHTSASDVQGASDVISAPVPNGAAALLGARPDCDAKGQPLATASLPELPGMKAGTVGSFPQSTPPHMLPLFENQLPPQPASVPCPRHMLPVPPLEEVSHPVTFTNIGRHKSTVVFRVTAAHPVASASIQVDPPSIVVRRGESVTVQVKVHIVSPGADVTALVFAEQDGGSKLALLVRALASKCVFGVPGNRLTRVRDCGYRVPAVLRSLRHQLEATGGLNSEGIFRIAPSERMSSAARKALNAGTFLPCSAAAGQAAAVACGDDAGVIVTRTAEAAAAAALSCTTSALDEAGLTPLYPLSGVTGYTAAHVIKAFFRQLPFPLMGGIPQQQLLGATSRDDALRLVRQHVRQPHADMLWWLVLLLARVTELGEVNRMSAKSCAIVLAPNLCSMGSTDNPMAALMASQRTTLLLSHLIEYTVEMRAAAGARKREVTGRSHSDQLAHELQRLAHPKPFLSSLLPAGASNELSSDEDEGNVAAEGGAGGVPAARLSIGKVSVPSLSSSGGAFVSVSALPEMKIPAAGGNDGEGSEGGSGHSAEGSAPTHRKKGRESAMLASYTESELAAALSDIRSGGGSEGPLSPPKVPPKKTKGGVDLEPMSATNSPPRGESGAPLSPTNIIESGSVSDDEDSPAGSGAPSVSTAAAAAAAGGDSARRDSELSQGKRDDESVQEGKRDVAKPAVGSVQPVPPGRGGPPPKGGPPPVGGPPPTVPPKGGTVSLAPPFTAPAAQPPPGGPPPAQPPTGGPPAMQPPPPISGGAPPPPPAEGRWAQPHRASAASREEMLRSMPLGLSSAPPSGSFDGSAGGSEGDPFEGGLSPPPPQHPRTGTAGGIGDVFLVEEEQPAVAEEYNAVPSAAEVSGDASQTASAAADGAVDGSAAGDSDARELTSASKESDARELTSASKESDAKDEEDGAGEAAEGKQ